VRAGSTSELGFFDGFDTADFDAHAEIVAA
jgi:hypothetical protein